jgi:hypothetical protein
METPDRSQIDVLLKNLDTIEADIIKSVEESNNNHEVAWRFKNDVDDLTEQVAAAFNYESSKTGENWKDRFFHLPQEGLKEFAAKSKDAKVQELYSRLKRIHMATRKDSGSFSLGIDLSSLIVKQLQAEYKKGYAQAGPGLSTSREFVVGSSSQIDRRTNLWHHQGLPPISPQTAFDQPSAAEEPQLDPPVYPPLHGTGTSAQPQYTPYSQRGYADGLSQGEMPQSFHLHQTMAQEQFNEYSELLSAQHPRHSQYPSQPPASSSDLSVQYPLSGDETPRANTPTQSRTVAAMAALRLGYPDNREFVVGSSSQIHRPTNPWHQQGLPPIWPQTAFDQPSAGEEPQLAPQHSRYPSHPAGSSSDPSVQYPFSGDETPRANTPTQSRMVTLRSRYQDNPRSSSPSQSQGGHRM